MEKPHTWLWMYCETVKFSSMGYVVFRTWLLSLIIMVLKFTHIVCCMHKSAVCFCTAEKHSLFKFIPSLVYRHLCCLRILATSKVFERILGPVIF